jgi:hypothetical protein
VCVSSASTGLCGGQWVTTVPTATRVENRLDAYPRTNSVPGLSQLFFGKHGLSSGVVMGLAKDEGIVWELARPVPPQLSAHFR